MGFPWSRGPSSTAHHVMTAMGYGAMSLDVKSHHGRGSPKRQSMFFWRSPSLSFINFADLSDGDADTHSTQSRMVAHIPTAPRKWSEKRGVDAIGSGVGVGVRGWDYMQD